MRPKLPKLTIPERFPKPVKSPITHSCSGYAPNKNASSSAGEMVQGFVNPTPRRSGTCLVYALQFCRLVSDALAKGADRRPGLPVELVQEIVKLSGLAFPGTKYSMDSTVFDPVKFDFCFDLYLETPPLSQSTINSTASLTVNTTHIQGRSEASSNLFLVAILKPRRQDIESSKTGPNDFLDRVARCKDGRLMLSAAHTDAGELGWTSSTKVCEQEFESLIHEGDALGVVRFASRRVGEVVELQLNTYFNPIIL